LDGPHSLRFEYREREVDASLFLTWDPPNAQDPVLLPDGSTGSGGGGGGGAPTGITATVNVYSLNFRAAPSTEAQILRKLNKGSSYPATGRTGDNLWVQLNVEGTTGWVYAQYVTLSGDINTLPVVGGGGSPQPTPQLQPIGVRGMVMGNLRIREQPTTRSKQIGLMPWGTVVDLLGKNSAGTWYLVKYGDIVGWSYAPWFRIVEGSVDQLPYADGTQPSYPPPPPTQGIIAQAYGNMRIRSGPGFQYPKIGKAIWGSRVQVLARSSNGLWYKIKHGDVVGWSYAAWYRIVQGDPNDIPVSDQ